MALAELWKTARHQLEDKHVQQVIAFAGSGKLGDANEACQEFRAFLSLLPSQFLARYADECLSTKFDGSGFALQDVVNEAGRRLDFAVTDGRYRGTTGKEIGFDGLWHSPNGNAIVVEVKTTDAYRIDLNTIAGYRRELIRSTDLNVDQSSMLIVVGREDTGDLEAQVRGSRHAWDVRLISIDALFRLVALKEEVGDPQVVHRIREVLVPREFTKLDAIIDFVFSATEDVIVEEKPEPPTQHPARRPRFVPVNFNDACAQRIQQQLGRDLIRKSKATYLSPDGSTALVCTVSKKIESPTKPLYWFAVHPYQIDVLKNAGEAYIAFGCGSEKQVILIPFQAFEEWLDGLWTTNRNDSFYWHVHIVIQDGLAMLQRRKGLAPIDLSAHLLA